MANRRKTLRGGFASGDINQQIDGGLGDSIPPIPDAPKISSTDAISDTTAYAEAVRWR